MLTVSKSSPVILLEICQKNGWRHSLYTLHSILGPEDETLFLYKVTIEATAVTYQPNKLSRRLDEAYYLAANYALERLGYFIKPITPQTLTPKHTLHYGSPSNFPAEYTISAPGHSMLTSSSPAEPIVRHTPKQPFPDSGLFLSSPPPLAPIRSHMYVFLWTGICLAGMTVVRSGGLVDAWTQLQGNWDGMGV